MKKILLYTVILIAVFGMSGCSGAIKNMKPAPKGAVIEKPDEEKAQVVFMRPQSMGYVIQSSVFDIDGDTEKIVGIVPAKAKVAYETTPGDHIFMVVGESGDFMYATLEAGKTYYVLVRPRMGVWKARFSLDPVHKGEVTEEKLQAWLHDCRLIEVSDATNRWAEKNSASIDEIEEEYYKDWLEKSKADRPKLEAVDGR